MVLVIEAFECEAPSHIVYSHKEEVEVPKTWRFSTKAVVLAAEKCVQEARRKMNAAKEFTKSVDKIS